MQSAAERFWLAREGAASAALAMSDSAAEQYAAALESSRKVRAAPARPCGLCMLQGRPLSHLPRCAGLECCALIRPAPACPQASEAAASVAAWYAQSALDRTAEMLLAASEQSAALAEVTAEAAALAASSALDSHYEAQHRAREAVWVSAGQSGDSPTGERLLLLLLVSQAMWGSSTCECWCSRAPPLAGVEPCRSKCRLVACRPRAAQDAVEAAASASNALKWRLQDAGEIFTETVGEAVATCQENFAVRVVLPKLFRSIELWRERRWDGSAHSALLPGH